MAGGYDLQEDKVFKKSAVFDMQSLSRNDVKDLPKELYDHIAALLDDGSETGKVVVGLGTTVDEDDNEVLNDSIWIYDPESGKYGNPFPVTAMTKAKAITIDGDVYIVGGCTDSGASNIVYKFDKSGNAAPVQFATLQQGRCNHAIADVSTVNEDGKVIPRILVIGGSTNAKEGKETPVLGENFAELVTENGSVSVAITDRNGEDDAELKTKGLISPAAVSVLMDDKEEDETIIAVVGGYLRDGEEGNFTWVSSPNLFVFSENGKNAFVYDKNGTANECARPSAGLLGSEEKNVIKYVAVNCGVKEVDRIQQNTEKQVVFVLQVKRVKDSDLGIEVFSSSVKDSLMEGNIDPHSDGEILDGPVAVDALGQVFMLGGMYVYQVGSYAVQ